MPFSFSILLFRVICGFTSTVHHLNVIICQRIGLIGSRIIVCHPFKANIAYLTARKLGMMADDGLDSKVF